MIALWTILIKFIFPVIYALNYGESFSKFIMWDFWWVAHLWLGWSFLNISNKPIIQPYQTPNQVSR